MPESAGGTTDALVTELRAVIADLRQDRDHWRTAFEQAQRPPPHAGASAHQSPRTPWRTMSWRERARYLFLS